MTTTEATATRHQVFCTLAVAVLDGGLPEPYRIHAMENLPTRPVLDLEFDTEAAAQAWADWLGAEKLDDDVTFTRLHWRGLRGGWAWHIDVPKPKPTLRVPCGRCGHPDGEHPEGEGYVYCNFCPDHLCQPVVVKGAAT